MQDYKAVKGVKDILPSESGLWQYVEKAASDILISFGFEEVKSPIFEYTELFARGIGQDTDIVEKEMYTFSDRDKRTLTLRPEGTAGIVRAFIEHSLYSKKNITRVFYNGPMFRHERPQAGRLRQFHQIGAELFGSASPLADVEIIYITSAILKKLGLNDMKIEINSLGCPECRPAYRNSIIEFLQNKKELLCDVCKNRLNTNPLRVLDCKNEQCINASMDAPKATDNLCSECKDHFNTVITGLDSLKVPYKINNRIVRGLDYYTRTTFEVRSEGLGAQNAVAAGGRYDNLVKDLGGPDTPAVGFAMGIERLIILLKDKVKPETAPKLFFAPIGINAKNYILPFAYSLSDINAVQIEVEYENRQLSNMLKKADRQAADWVFIIGEDELSQNNAILRNMKDKSQYPIPLPPNTDYLINIIKNK